MQLSLSLCAAGAVVGYFVNFIPSPRLSLSSLFSRPFDNYSVIYQRPAHNGERLLLPPLLLKKPGEEREATSSFCAPPTTREVFLIPGTREHIDEKSQLCKGGVLNSTGSRDTGVKQGGTKHQLNQEDLIVAGRRKKRRSEE